MQVIMEVSRQTRVLSLESDCSQLEFSDASETTLPRLSATISVLSSPLNTEPS